MWAVWTIQVSRGLSLRSTRKLLYIIVHSFSAFRQDKSKTLTPYAHRHGEELRKIIKKENEENKKKADAQASESTVRAVTASMAVPGTTEAAVLSGNEDHDPTFSANAKQKQSQDQKQQPVGTVVVTLDGKVAGVSTARPAAGTTRRVSGVGDRNDM